MIDKAIEKIKNTYFIIEWLAFSSYVLIALVVSGVIYREPGLLLIVIPIGGFCVLFRRGCQNIWNMGDGVWLWIYRGILVVGSSGIYLVLVLFFDGHALLVGKLFYRGVDPLPVMLLKPQLFE